MTMPLNEDSTPKDMQVVAQKIAAFRELASQKKLSVRITINLEGEDAFVYHLINELRDGSKVPTEQLPLHLIQTGMMMEMAHLHKQLAKTMFGDLMEGLF